MKISSTFTYPFHLLVGENQGIIGSSQSGLGNLLPAHALGRSHVGVFINTNGNLCVLDRSFEFTNLADKLSLGFVYNSTQNNWRLKPARELQIPQSGDLTLRVTEVDGHETTYQYDVNTQTYYASAVNSADGIATIKFNVSTNNWEYFDPKSRQQEIFNAQGQVACAIDQAGNVTEFKYSAQNQIETIKTNGAIYTYERTPNTISFYRCEHNKPRILLHTYHLDAMQRVVKSMPVTGNSVTYLYSSDSSLLEKIMQDDTTEMNFGYDAAARIQTLRAGEGSGQYHFQYAIKTFTVIDPNGVPCSLTMNAQNLLESKTEEAGFLGIPSSEFDKTHVEYYANGQVKIITYPDNSQETFAYAPLTGLLIKHTRRDQQVYEYQYDNNLLLATTISHASTKQILTKRFVYDTKFNGQHAVLRFVISPCGRVTEYIRDEQGLIRHERNFTNVVYASDLEATYANLTQWVETIKATQGLQSTQLMTYLRDTNGRIKRKRCFATINADGTGVEDTAMSEITYEVNELDLITHESQLISLTQVAGICQDKKECQIIKKYDGNGDLVAEHVGANTGPRREQITNISFNGNKTFTVHPSKLITEQTHNSLGSITQEVEQYQFKKEVTNYQCNATDELDKIIDPAKTTQLLGYDKQHELSYAITTKGYVTETLRNEKSNYEITTHYNSTIFLEDIYKNAQIDYARLQEQLKYIPNFRRTYQFHDSEKRLRYQVDAAGQLIEFRYNAFGKQIAKISYKDAIKSEELNALLIGVADLERMPNRKDDKIHSEFYDLDGYKIAEQDPAGYITTYQLDAVGDITAKIIYATPDLNFTSELSELKLVASTDKDIKNYYYRDAKGQCRFEVDAEGFVIEHRYHPNGKKKASIFYQTAVSLDWLNNPVSHPDVVEHPNDQKLAYFYDEFDRLVRTEGPFDKVTTYSFDKMNNLVSTYIGSNVNTAKRNSDNYRGIQKHFDVFGKIIAEANPYLAEKLLLIDQDASLSPQEKTAAKEKLWATQSLRCHYKDKLKISEIDSNNNKTLFFYDADERLEFTIAAGGVITQYTHNAFNEVVVERHYAKFFPEQRLAAVSGGIITPEFHKELCALQQDDKDAVTKFEYTKLGKVFRKIDPEKNLYHYEYDEFNRLKLEQVPVEKGKQPLIITHEYDKRDNETQRTQEHAETKIKVVEKKEYLHPLAVVTAEVNGLGQETRYEYDRLGKRTLSKKVQQDGNEIIVLKQNRDAFQRLISETNALGATTKHEYFDAQHLEIITHPDQTQTKITKNIFSETVNVTNALGEEDNFTHAPDGQIRKHTNALNQTTYADYDLLGQRIMQRDAKQVETSYQYKNNELIEKVADVANIRATEKYEPDAFGNMQKIVDASNVVIINQFDRNANKISSTVDPHQDDELPHVNFKTLYHYNCTGKQTDAIQGERKCQFHTKNEYDALNRLTQEMTDPKNLKLSKSKIYNNANQVINETDPRGFIKAHFHDDLGRKCFTYEQISATHGRMLSWQYDAANNITEARISDDLVALAVINNSSYASIKALPQSKNDNITNFRYDLMQRERFQLKHVFNPATNAYEIIIREIRYDKAGREVIHIQYAAMVAAESCLNLNTQQLEEFVAQLSNQADYVERKILDAVGREKYLIDVDGFVTEHVYDDNGNITTLNRFKQAFTDTKAILNASDAELLVKLQPILTDIKNVASKHYLYDTLNRCTHKVTPSGQVIRKIYALNNKPTEIIHFKAPAKFHGNERLCLQDAQERMVSADDKSIKLTYDAMKRLKTSTDPRGNTEKFGYDAVGNNIHHTDRNGNKWHFHFDTAKRKKNKVAPTATISSVSQSKTGLVESVSRLAIVTDYTTDASGNITQITKASGLAEARHVRMEYDGLNQLTSTIKAGILVDNPNAVASLTAMPTVIKELTTSLVYNTKGNVVASKDEGDRWNLYAYDSLGRCIYEIDKDGSVTENQYKSHNKPVKKIHYANRLAINTADYSTKKIAADFIQSQLKPDANNDRTTSMEYDKRGNTTAVITDKKFYYSDGVSGIQEPETRKTYDFQGCCTSVMRLIRPGVYATDYTWYDNKKNIIAEVKYHAAGTAYLTDYKRDVAGNILKKIDYAAPMIEAVTLADTPADLLKKVKPCQNDRLVQYQYNKLNKCLRETYYNAIYTTVELKDGVPTPTQHVGNLAIRNRYDDMGNLARTIYEDGSAVRFFYDERGHMCGYTKIGFTPFRDTAKIIPFITHGINAFGQVVRTTQHATALKDLPMTVKMPHVDPHANDRIELKLLDNRGLLVLKQDAEQNLFAFTRSATGKLARQFCCYIEDAGDKKLIPHIDEIRNSYNPCDLPIVQQQLRDNKLIQQTFSKYNAFKQVEAEGPDGGKWELYNRYDQAGHCFTNNQNHLAEQVTLTDLAGHPTLTLKSPDAVLNPITQTDLLELIKIPDRNSIQWTESKVDFTGQLLAIKAPFWFQANFNGIPTESYERDRWNNVLEKTDALGNITVSTYGIRNEILTVAQPKDTYRNDKAIVENYIAITTHGYTQRGVLTCVTNPLQCTEWYKLDEAGQLLQEINADGQITNTQRISVFGESEQDIDGRNVATLIDRNRLGKVTTVKDPLYKHNFSYNIHGYCANRTDRFGHAYIFNYLCGDLTQTITPLKLSERMTYDHNHELLTLTKANGIVFRVQRDYGGNKLVVTDLSGVVTKFTYNKMMVCYEEKASNLGHYDTMTYQEYNVGDAAFPTVTPIVNRGVEVAKHINRVYEYGLLKTIYDYAKNRRTEFGYDMTGRMDAMEVHQLAHDILISSVKSTFNNQGWITKNVSSVRTATSFHSVATFVGDFDAAANRRFESVNLTIAGYGKDCHVTPILMTRASSYHRSSLINILHGAFAPDGSVVMLPNIGVQKEYLGGFCIAENILYAAVTDPIKIAIGYNEASEFSDTIASNGMSTSRRTKLLNDASILNTYTEVLTNPDKLTKGFYSQRISRLDANRREVVDQYQTGLLIKHLSVSYYLGAIDVPTHVMVNTVTDSYEPIYTTSTLVPRGFDDYRAGYSYGFKTFRNETKAADSLQLYDPDGYVVGKINTADEPDAIFGTYPAQTFIEMANGVPISKFNTNKAPSPTTSATHFFADIQNRFVAGYTATTNASANVAGKHAYYHHTNIGLEIKPVVNESIFPSYPTSLGKVLPSIDDGPWNIKQLNPPINPAMGDRPYTVKQGDTLESIALQQFGDRNFARSISKNNGYFTDALLSPGMMIFLPEHIANTNRAENINNIQFFVGAIQGSILPFVGTPIAHHKNHTSFLKVLVSVLATGLAMVAAMYLAPCLLSAASQLGFIANSVALAGTAGLEGGTVTAATVIAGSVAGAITDAAKQGFSMTLKIQNNFSINELIETTIASGASIGPMQNFKNATTAIKQAKAMLQMVQIAIETQLVEMGFGTRTHFDPNAVVMQLSSMVVAAEVAKIPGEGEMPDAIRSVTGNAINAAVGSTLYHTPIQAETIAAQSIGDRLDSEVQGRIKNQQAVGKESKDKYTKIREKQREHAHAGSVQKPCSDGREDNLVVGARQNASGTSTKRIESVLTDPRGASRPLDDNGPGYVSMMWDNFTGDVKGYIKNAKHGPGYISAEDAYQNVLLVSEIVRGRFGKDVIKGSYFLVKEFLKANPATKRSMVARGAVTGAEMFADELVTHSVAHEGKAITKLLMFTEKEALMKGEMVGPMLFKAGSSKGAKQPIKAANSLSKSCNYGSKSAEEMAVELRTKVSKNAIKFQTVKKSGHYDISGRQHYDKVTKKSIPAPHVQEYDLHAGPNGKMRISRKSEIVRAATKSDIRIARKLAESKGLILPEKVETIDDLPRNNRRKI